MLDYTTLKKMYQKSKFIFLPNEKDASPRVLAEAMATDIPCFINEKILGGWKYVNDKTGQFFTEDNIERPLKKFLNNLNNNKFKPRDFFINNYSVENSGKRLKDFVYNHYSDRINIPKDKVEYLTPEFVKKDFQLVNLQQDNN